MNHLPIYKTFFYLILSPDKIYEWFSIKKIMKFDLFLINDTYVNQTCEFAYMTNYNLKKNTKNITLLQTINDSQFDIM